jgi:hypothetical protein
MPVDCEGSCLHCLAYQPPASCDFLLKQISHQPVLFFSRDRSAPATGQHQQEKVVPSRPPSPSPAHTQDKSACSVPQLSHGLRLLAAGERRSMQRRRLQKNPLTGDPGQGETPAAIEDSRVTRARRFARPGLPMRILY